jgi:hyaluronate lyase
LTLTVNAAVATPVITSTNSASGTVGSAFSYQITATNNPTSFGASNLPAGLTNNPSTGLISGTPASAGTNNVTLSASNAGGTGTKNLTLTIGTDYFALIRSRRSSSLIADGLAASSVSSISSKAYGYWKTNTIGTNPPVLNVLNTNANSSSTGLWSDLPLKYPSAVSDANTASGNMVTTFSRIEKMAQAWATPGCSATVVTITGSVTNTNTVTLTGNVELATAVVNALDWMVANNYTSTATQYGNWFDWEVQGALNFVDTQILIYSQLSAAQIASYAAAVDNYGPNSANNRQEFSWGPLTGANTTSVALVATLRGALAKEASKIAEINGSSAVPEVFLPVTDGDGFYEDGSYVFHGNVAYNGHYGYVMLEGVTILTALLDETPWTIVDSNYPYVYDWITDGFMPFYYHGSFMDCVRGRSVGTSGETGPDVGAEILGYIQIVANNSLTPTNLKTTFNNFVATPQPTPGQYHFYNMDRVVAHRDNYSFALSMSSERVNNYEDNFGDANTKGYFQGDGMTYLYVGSTDTQFVNGYWPSVDIYHLTGTTTEQGTVSTPSATDQSFVGGADVEDSNGSPVYGVAAFSLHPYLEQKDTSVVPSVTRSNVSTLYGKKSYFMFKDEVVCLGAGITAGSTNEIHTTVENRAMGTASNTATLWVNGASTSRSLGSSGVLTNLTNCAIQGVGGYHFFDSPGNLQAAFQQSSGTWGAIHPGDSDTKTYTNNYLKLYYRHGVRPTNATYAYTLLPAMTPSEVKGYAYNPQTTILSNTATVQAVKNPALGIVAANFWDSTGGTADLLTVNRSCSVITKETYNSIAVGISDPSQSLTNNAIGIITVDLDRSGTLFSKDPEVSVTSTNPTIKLTVNVSQAKGKTIHAVFTPATAAPQITSSPNLLAWTGSPVSYQIASGESGVTYAVDALPPGLKLYESGLIYGTPTESGTFTTTISATSSAGRVGYANLTTQISDNLSTLSTTYKTSGTWVCPANVTAVQVECWGGGGAGGSACQNVGSAAAGGGGAGGAYAKVVSYPVTPGNTYYINVGAGGTNSSTNNGTNVSGGDSWFNFSNSPSTTILAKGGGGGASAIGDKVYGSGGLPTAGSLGDVIYAGGAGIAPPSGRFGGGGGGSAGTNSVGLAPASNTNGVGASAVMGGGNGGNANPTASSSSNGQSPTIPPGGGGGGARDGSYVLPQVRSGGAGAAGQVILTLRMKTNSTISILGGTFTYSGSPQGPGLESVTKTGSTNSNLTYRYEGVAPTLYSASSTRPTDAGTYTVTATVPEDTNSMAAVSTPALFTIVPATPPPPSASPITYGQTLASSVVSGTANVGGVWRWANEALIPPAGISFQTATFTPTETKNYTTTTANVSVTVNPAIPIFSLPGTGAITLPYGEALSFFNWSRWNSIPDGVLSWVDPNLTPGLGDSSQSVVFTPSNTNNYAVVNTNVIVRVNRADPVITQAPVATAIASGETLASSFLSGGVANVEGKFAWTSSGNIPSGTGNQDVTFTPTDLVNYNSVTVPVNVVVTEPFRQGSWVNLADDGRLLYQRDNLGNRIPDFTACGYKAGREGIPYVPTRVVVKPGDGDDRARIQAGIDRVAAMTPDANGFRGAVLLTAGE